MYKTLCFSMLASHDGWLSWRHGVHVFCSTRARKHVAQKQANDCRPASRGAWSSLGRCQRQGALKPQQSVPKQLAYAVHAELQAARGHMCTQPSSHIGGHSYNALKYCCSFDARQHAMYLQSTEGFAKYQESIELDINLSRRKFYDCTVSAHWCSASCVMQLKFSHQYRKRLLWKLLLRGRHGMLGWLQTGQPMCDPAAILCDPAEKPSRQALAIKLHTYRPWRNPLPGPLACWKLHIQTIAEAYCTSGWAADEPAQNTRMTTTIRFIASSKCAVRCCRRP